MSRIADKIRAYVNDPTVAEQYGAWGILRHDQRRLIRELCDTCDMFEKTADELARKQSEWISVDERLPEDMLPTDYKHKTIKVLVAIRGKNGITIRTQQRFLDYTYRDDKRTAFWTWRFSGGDVTHWMPLPEAPKMKGDKE